jgi:hypothetical protein
VLEGQRTKRPEDGSEQYRSPSFCHMQKPVVKAASYHQATISVAVMDSQFSVGSHGGEDPAVPIPLREVVGHEYAGDYRAGVRRRDAEETATALRLESPDVWLGWATVENRVLNPLFHFAPVFYVFRKARRTASVETATNTRIVWVSIPTFFIRPVMPSRETQTTQVRSFPLYTIDQCGTPPCKCE